MFFEELFFIPKHCYEVCVDGLKSKINKTFCSRQTANEYMYDVCGKYGLHIVEVYDDKHFKTYKCSNGVKFYINRM